MSAYKAFISYSHAKDKPIARELQHVIQTLGKRWYQRRSVRIFRDDTSLTATPALWPTITGALEQSDFLILLASPEGAASEWVNKEVEWWLSHKSSDSLLIALTAGSLIWDGTANGFLRVDDNPVPPAAAGHFPTEPLWIDLRLWRAGGPPARRDTAFKSLASRIAARVRNELPEDLWSEELRQQRHNLRLAYAATGSLSILTALAIGASLYARNQQALAEFNYLRQAEITASQYLRQGEFAKAVHSLENVVAASDRRLMSPARYRILLPRFEALGTVLKRNPPWSAMAWQDRVYVRGDGDLELYPVGEMADPEWLRTQDLIIVFSSGGNIAVFDRRSRKVVASKVAKDRFTPCDLEIEADGSVRIYGLGQAGASLGGAFYSRWSVSSLGALTYETDPYNGGTWQERNICPDLGKGARYAETVKRASEIAFPAMIDERAVWRTERRDAVKKQDAVSFFDRLEPHKIAALAILMTDGENKPPPTTAQEAAGRAFCWDGGYCEAALDAKNLTGVRVLSGMSSWGMGGESFSLCARVTADNRINCTGLGFAYGNQSLIGIRFSPQEDLAVAHGHAFDLDDRRASLAIARGPDFSDWETPLLIGAETDDVLDARVSPDSRYLAVLSGRGVLIGDIRNGYKLVGRFNGANILQIAWISSSGLAFLTAGGALRARALDGAELWNDLDLSHLPFMEEQKEKGIEKGDVRTWWLESDSRGDVLLVGNGQSAVVVDARLGAPVTGDLALAYQGAGVFARPGIEIFEAGGIRIELKNRTLRRRTVDPAAEISHLVGRPGQLSLSSLLTGSNN